MRQRASLIRFIRLAVQPVQPERSVQRGFNGVVHDSRLHELAGLLLLPSLPSLLSHRKLRRVIRVRDSQHPRGAVRSFHRVPLDHRPHAMTLIAVGQPVLGFVRNRERRPATLQRPGRRSHRLNPPGTPIRVNDLLPNINPMFSNTLLSEQGREQSHRVPGLILRRGRNLNPRRRIRHPRRTIRSHVTHTARPNKLDSRNHRSKRVLTPTLQPLDHTIPKQEPATVINRIPPHQKPLLLRRQLKRVTIRMLQILIDPTDQLETQRKLRENKPGPIPPPRRTDIDRFNRRQRGERGLLQDPSPPQAPPRPAPTPPAPDDDQPPPPTENSSSN